MLEKERRDLQSVVDEATGQSDRARELHGEVSRQESDLAAMMEGVGALFSLLNSALQDESFTKDPEAAVQTQLGLEKEVLRSDEGNGGKMRRRRRRDGLQSAAARVRATSHRNRTPDEKRWVALDAVLNPGLYHHVTLAEAEEMRWDALYYTRLDREDVLRVLSLPPQVHLALPFLHTPDEVDAHELLSRYSHGISADHFARLDRDSQDVCRRGAPFFVHSSASSAATTGGNTTALAARQKVPPKGARDDIDAGATRRVLGCMQRAAEASLKLPAEREDEEAVWCALDNKLRPNLYRDSDEEAADRAEELHREADAREDARHAWLATPFYTPKSVGTPKVSEVAGTGDGTTMGGVVEQKRNADKADEVLAAEKAVEVREALVTGVANWFTEDDIKAIATAVAGESLGRGELVQEAGLATTVANDREASTRGDEGGRGRTPTSAGVNGGDAEAFALERDTREVEKDGQRSKPDDDNDDEKAMNPRTHQQAEERSRLEETVRRVLSRFLVTEEETPLGRDMTRSLAILQEVALRLEKGQHNVFSGLNPQSALAMVRSRWQPSTSAPSPAEERSTAPNSTASTGERGQGEQTLAEGAAAESKGEEGALPTEAAATAPPKEAAEAALSVDAGGIKTGSEDAKQCLGDNKTTASESASRRDSGGSGNEGSVANRGGVSMASKETPRKLEKVFGSWEEVHPAALGISSQETPYLVVEGQEAHPASFRSVSSKGTEL